jgi:hypothetical protein
VLTLQKELVANVLGFARLAYNNKEEKAVSAWLKAEDTQTNKEEQ